MDQTLPTNPNATAYKPATGEDLPFEAPGRYSEEETELGRGGIGRIILRKDLHLEREVAFKELLPEFRPSRGTEARAVAERFLTEARVTARLEHPGVVPIYELGRRLDGSLYYAMKRVRGRTLAAALDACGGVRDRLTLLPHVLDVFQTLAYAHSNGVIHRDLKPANIMVGEFGETQVLDWGLARVRGVTDVPGHGAAAAPASAASATASSTQHGDVLGTPAYMSPEQASGHNTTVDERSDVWALGAMLFEVLTGQTVFEADDVQGMISAVKSAPVRKVRQLEPDAPRAVVAVVEKALERNPHDRYASAVDLAESFQYALQRPTLGGRPVRSLAVVGVLGLLLVLAVSRWVSVSRDVDAARELTEQMYDKSARSETAELARLAREALEKKDFAHAEALAHQAIDVKGAESDPIARGILAVLEGAPRPVLRWDVGTPGCAALTAERGLIACPTFGGVELRKGDSGELIRSLSTGPTGWQHAALFLPDGTLLSGGDDRLIHVWDATTGSELAHWSGHEGPILSMALRGGTIASGSIDGEVRVWAPSTGTSRVVAHHNGPVRALAFTREGLLASSGPDGLRVWDVDAAPKGEPPPLSTGQPAPENAPRISLDRPAQVLFSTSGLLLLGVERTVFQLEKDDAWPRIEGALDDVTSIAAVPGLLIAGDARGRVRAVDSQGNLAWQLTGVEHGVRALAVDADEPRWLIVASRTHMLQAWEFPEALGAAPLGDAVAWGYCDGNSGRSAVLLGDRDGRVRNAEGKVLFEGPAGRVRALAGAGGQIVWGGDDGTVRLWGEPSRVVAHRGRPVTAVAVSPDGTLGAFGFDDGSFVLHQLALDKEVASSRGPAPQALAFSTDGKWLASGRSDKRVALVDAATGKETALFEVDGVPSALAFTGTTLAVGSEHGATLIDLSNGHELGRLGGATEAVRSLSFSPDGSRLVGGSEDGQAYVWSVARLRLTHVLPLDAGDVTLVRFVDKEHLVAAGADHSLRAVKLR